MPEWVANFLPQIITAAAIWGAIRADVKNIHSQLTRLENRFNNHVERRFHHERNHDDEN